MAKKLADRLADHRSETVRQTIELDSSNRSGDILRLDWDKAVKLLEERNLNLQQNRLRVAQLKKTRDNQWKEWLPRVGAYANLQTSLENLGELSFSDISATLVAPLSIPNPISEHARALQNALSYLEAQDSSLLTYRRQVTSLYRIFSQYDSLLEQENLEASLKESSPSISIAIRSLERKVTKEESISNIQRNLAQMLNLPGENPLPIAHTKPNIGYEKQYKNLKPGRNYGQLAVRLSAYQIEGALLREKGIKLSRWPLMSLSGSTPSVYDSRNDDQSYLDSERIYLFGGLSQSFDVTGRQAASVESAEQNTQYVKDNLRQRLDQETREWIRLQKRYEMLLIKETLAEDRLKIIRNRKEGSSAFLELETIRSAQIELSMLRQSKEYLDLEIWTWDDTRWN